MHVLDTFTPEPLNDEAVTRAIEEGGIVIAAAGNYLESMCRDFPATVPGVISVVASTNEDHLAGGMPKARGVSTMPPSARASYRLTCPVRTG